MLDIHSAIHSLSVAFPMLPLHMSSTSAQAAPGPKIRLPGDPHTRQALRSSIKELDESMFVFTLTEGLQPQLISSW